MLSVVVARKKSFDNAERAKLSNRSSRPFFLEIEKRRFVTKKIFRTHPILAGFHRGIDGALIGVIFCVAFMSALALHSQYLWTRSFARLEMTRDLNQRLEESITHLERYFLVSTTLSRPMVATKATDLLYIDPPLERKTSIAFIPKAINKLRGLLHNPIKQGY